MDVVVRPNGISVDFSKHYPGSASDFTIFTEQIVRHKRRIRKKENDDQYVHNGVLHVKNKDQ